MNSLVLRFVMLGVTCVGVAMTPLASRAQPAPWGTAVTCCNGTSKVRWSNPSATMRLNTSDFPIGSLQRDDINKAAAQWGSAAVTGTSFNFSIVSGSANDNVIGNGLSEIDFQTGPSPGPDPTIYGTTFLRVETVPGCTNQFVQCCFSNPCRAPLILEADITFYSQNSVGPFTWLFGAPTPLTNSGDWYNSQTNLFRIAALHELGHALGLAIKYGNVSNAHSTDAQSTMYGNMPHGGWHGHASDAQRVRPLAYDVTVLRFLYPGFNPVNDEYAINAQHYSQQLPPNVLPLRTLSYDNQINPTLAEFEDVVYYPRRIPPITGQATNSARVGDEVRFRICYGNRGPNPGTSIPVAFYLSPDNLFGGNDTAVTNPSSSQFTGGLPQGSQGCSLMTIYVPNVVPGNYHIFYTVGPGTGPRIGMLNTRLNVIP